MCKKSCSACFFIVTRLLLTCKFPTWKNVQKQKYIIIKRMVELKIEIPEDLAEELSQIPKEELQLIFSRLLKGELEKIRQVQSIVARSKMTKRHAKKLAEEVDLALAKRYENY